jgi:hypothetical protein
VVEKGFLKPPELFAVGTDAKGFEVEAVEAVGGVEVPDGAPKTDVVFFGWNGFVVALNGFGVAENGDGLGSFDEGIEAKGDEAPVWLAAPNWLPKVAM